jgi:hypothetical protein
LLYQLPKIITYLEAYMSINWYFSFVVQIFTTNSVFVSRSGYICSCLVQYCIYV